MVINVLKAKSSLVIHMMRLFIIFQPLCKTRLSQKIWEYSFNASLKVKHDVKKIYKIDIKRKKAKILTGNNLKIMKCKIKAIRRENKANRHKSRAPSIQRQTDRPTDRRTEWLIESRARD